MTGCAAGGVEPDAGDALPPQHLKTNALSPIRTTAVTPVCGEPRLDYGASDVLQMPAAC